MADMKFETRRLSELSPAEYNPRVELKDGDPEYESLKKSIDELGYVEPMIINSDGTIIGGHQRYNALVDLGFDEVPVIVLDVDKDTERAINVALNKIDGEWDEVKLKDVLTDIDFSGISLETVGFSQSEFDDLCLRLGDDLEAQEDDFDVDAALDAIKEPKSKRGDVYQLGRHRLMCGDSTSFDDIDFLMDGIEADLLLTDPPYGIDYGSNLEGRGDGHGGADKYGWKSYGAPDWDKERPSQNAFELMRSFSKEQIIWGGNYYSDYLPPKMCWLVWDKGQRDFSLADGELAWTSYDKALRIKTYSRAAALNDGKIHPTQKPIEVMRWCIQDIAERNGKVQTVLDLYGGSGSTLMTCEQIGKTCYMMELEPMYIDLIIDRWENYTGDKAVKL